jgi:hypothetical protein
MAGEAAASGLRFFLDRGLGAVVVPRALRAAGWTLETMDERYGTDQSQNIQDTQWIEEATLAGDVLLCKDLAIAQNPLEAQAVYMTSARPGSGSSAPPFRHRECQTASPTWIIYGSGGMTAPVASSTNIAWWHS